MLSFYMRDKHTSGGNIMNNNLLWIMQTMSIDQLKAEIDNNRFVNKNLKDFENGKKIIDNR